MLITQTSHGNDSIVSIIFLMSKVEKDIKLPPIWPLLFRSIAPWEVCVSIKPIRNDLSACGFVMNNESMCYGQRDIISDRILPGYFGFSLLDSEDR